MYETDHILRPNQKYVCWVDMAWPPTTPTPRQWALYPKHFFETFPNPVYSVPCESGEVRRFSWNMTVESLVLMSEELIMCTILLLVVGCIWKSAFWESRREIVFVEIYFVSVLLLCSAIEWKRYRNVVLWYMKLDQYFAQYICLLLWGCSRSEEKVRKKSRVCSVTCTVPKCAVVLSDQVKE